MRNGEKGEQPSFFTGDSSLLIPRLPNSSFFIFHSLFLADRL